MLPQTLGQFFLIHGTLPIYWEAGSRLPPGMPRG